MSHKSPGPFYDEMQPANFPNMANDDCERLAQRICSTSAPFILTDNETGLEDEGAAPRHRRTTIKCGKLPTRDTHVVKRIKWPHEMVFTSMGQGPVYKDMSLALFANGYLAIVVEESNAVKDMVRHLQELFRDVEVYGWMVVREYHAPWLQLLEQGRAAWGDDTKRAQLRRLMVLSKSSLSSKTAAHTHPPPPASTPGGEREVWVHNPALQAQSESLHWF